MTNRPESLTYFDHSFYLMDLEVLIFISCILSILYFDQTSETPDNIEFGTVQEILTVSSKGWIGMDWLCKSPTKPQDTDKVNYFISLE